MDRISTHRDSEGEWETLACLVYPLSTGFIFPSPQMQKQTLSQRECFAFGHSGITRGARVPLNLNLKAGALGHSPYLLPLPSQCFCILSLSATSAGSWQNRVYNP